MERVEVLPNIDFPNLMQTKHAFMSTDQDSASAAEVRAAPRHRKVNNATTVASPPSTAAWYHDVPSAKHKLTLEEKNAAAAHAQRINSTSILASPWLSVFCMCLIVVLVIAVIWLVYKLNDANTMIKRLNAILAQATPISYPMAYYNADVPNTYQMHNTRSQEIESDPTCASGPRRNEKNIKENNNHFANQNISELTISDKSQDSERNIDPSSNSRSEPYQDIPPTKEELEEMKKRLNKNDSDVTTSEAEDIQSQLQLFIQKK